MAEKAMTSSTSLVKYNNAHIVKEREPKKKKLKDLIKTRGGGFLHDNVEDPEEILHYILPPREWRANGLLWRQKVSSAPASRSDVLILQEELNKRLKMREARDLGFCPIRRELYDQCFDEIIRQVTLHCVERGLLLVRIRDEIRMTLHAYHRVYKSSVGYGMRKTLQAEQDRMNFEIKISELKDEKLLMKREVKAQALKNEQTKRRLFEEREAEKRKYLEEINQLKRTVKLLKDQYHAFAGSQGIY